MAVHVLLARQRSGTGAFGSLVSQHPDMDYVGEVFHADYDNASQANVFYDSRINYFRFLLERVREDPARALPDANRKNYDGFMAHLQATVAQKPHVFIDVKYGSTHHFNGGWHVPLEMPKFLRFAMRDQLRIVHLKRQNLLKMYVSGRLAELNNVWHATAADKVVVRQVAVDKHALLRFLQSGSRTASQFDGYLRGYPHAVELHYEALFRPDGCVDGAELGKVAGLVGIDPASLAGLQPGFVKQATDNLAEVITNYDEIAGHLAATPYAAMLRAGAG